jgi:Family of unknown function (DUF6452)
MKKIFLIVVVFCFLLSSCERDDVCDPETPTTPMLVIEFYDSFFQMNTKPISNLAIAEFGNPIGFALANGTKIKIPLKTDQNVTKYRFIKNFSDPVNPLINEDILEFSYTRKNEYISRACGFKTVFTLNPSLPVLSEPTTPDGAWIQGIVVTQPNITNENETHIKIYF